MARKKSFINNLIFALKYATSKEIRHSWMLTCECCGSSNIRALSDGLSRKEADKKLCLWDRSFQCNNCGAKGHESQQWG